MKLIKLIQGAYGYRAPGSLVTELVTTKSDPFEVDDKEAKRLISLGVAQYAEIAVATPQKEVIDPATGENTPPEGEGENGQKKPDQTKPEYGDFMTVAELKAYADEQGIEYEDRTTKAKLIEAIDTFYQAAVDDGEQPPVLTPQDPVQ